MLSNIHRNIIIRAIKTRMESGQKPDEILSGYKNLTAEEKEDIVAAVMPEED